MVGRTISHYRITAELGVGGMGVVYLADDLRLKRTVALKFLPEHLSHDPAARRRLECEAQAAASLHHPGICTVHEIGEADGRLFIAMAHCEGRTLRTRLAEGPLTVAATLDLGIALAAALAHAHAAGVVHRDLKPGNVMLDPAGQPVLMDFGLARAADRTQLTAPGATLGTPLYMSPEQARGRDVDHRTDLWALGALLYEALTGRPPFRGEHEQAVIYGILNLQPEPLSELIPEIPREFECIIARCLTKDPAQRYQSAAELAADLHRLRGGDASEAPTVSMAASRRSRRRPVLIASAAAVVMAGALGIWLAISHGRAIAAIAVLPCLDVGDQHDQSLFADGMTDGLITELQRVCGQEVRVIGRTSVMHFKNSQQTLPEIARELGVDAIVEATVLRHGDLVRVAAKLIRARPEEQLWAQSFERTTRDVLALHGDVARLVAEQIHVALRDPQQLRLQRVQTVAPAAFELCALGQSQWNEGSLAGIEASVTTFQRALAVEPDYVDALGGLANAYAALGCQGGRHPNEVYPPARRLLNRALALDPVNPPALTALAHITWECDWDFPEAERLLHVALDENPSNALGRHVLGFMLCTQGRFEEGVAELERARSLDPYSPRLSADLGWAYVSMRDTTRGLARLRQTHRDFPEWDESLFRAYQDRVGGDFSHAIALLTDGPTNLPWNGRLAMMCSLAAAAGDTQQARSYLARLVARGDTTYVSPALIAQCYDELAEPEQSLAWYDRALAIRDPHLARARYLLKHHDPRFVAIARKVGFQTKASREEG